MGTFRGNTVGKDYFYTDLTFDPFSGDLIGTGRDDHGRFVPWRLDGVTAMTGKNLLLDYVDAFPDWDEEMFDGLAYNRITGALYASGDDSGVYEIDKLTGKMLQNVGNNASPPDTRRIGTDLAVRSDAVACQVPPCLLNIPSVPEPPASVLGGLGLFAIVGMRRGLHRARSRDGRGSCRRRRVRGARWIC